MATARKISEVSAVLLVPAARDLQELDLFWRGLEWSGVPEWCRVVYVINNSEGDNASPLVIAAVKKHAKESDDVCVYEGHRDPGCNGAGVALYEAIKGHPADVYIKVDSDMFPVVKTWLAQLVVGALVSSNGLCTGMTNVNGHCALPFCHDIGVPWSMVATAESANGHGLLGRFTYGDVEPQARIWQVTMAHWDRVVSWHRRPHFAGEVPLGEIYLMAANNYAFTKEWFDRRDDRAAWEVVGEDERVINTAVGGDTGYVYWDQGALMLHWGYTIARPALQPMWHTLKDKLGQLWGEEL